MLSRTAAEVWSVAAWVTLWLSGCDATCDDELASKGVAFIGATDAATLAPATATGPFAAAASPGPEGPFDQDVPAPDHPDTAGETGPTGPAPKAAEGEPCWSLTP